MRPTLAACAVALVASACFIGFNEVDGDGDIVTEVRDHDGYTEVSLSGIGRMILAEADEFTFSIRADSNLLEYIETSVRSDTLEVGQRSGVNLDPSNGIEYMVTVPELMGVEVSGVGQVDIDDLEATDLRLEISGVGGVSIERLDADSVVVDLSGVGSIEIGGSSTTLDVDASGTGTFIGGDLRAEDAIVQSSGVGTVIVWATGTLDVDTSGVGSVQYYGSPSVAADLSGLGGLESLGDK